MSESLLTSNERCVRLKITGLGAAAPDDVSMRRLFCLPLSLLWTETDDGVFDDSAAVHTHTHTSWEACLLERMETK